MFIANIPPAAHAEASYFDGDLLAAGQAVTVPADAPNAVAHVSCGVVARSLRAVVVDPDTGAELPDGAVGEFWLHGDNVGRGYWNQPEQTRLTFGAQLASRVPAGSRAEDVAADATWLRTGDLGMFVDGQLYVTGRIVDLLHLGGRTFYPQEIEATVADAADLVRRGYVAAVSAPVDGAGAERLVILAERATGTSRTDPGPAIEAIRSGRVGAPRPTARRRADPARRRDPADHQRQAGPAGIPDGVSGGVTERSAPLARRTVTRR